MNNLGDASYEVACHNSENRMDYYYFNCTITENAKSLFEDFKSRLDALIKKEPNLNPQCSIKIFKKSVDELCEEYNMSKPLTKEQDLMINDAVFAFIYDIPFKEVSLSHFISLCQCENIGIIKVSPYYDSDGVLKIVIKFEKPLRNNLRTRKKNWNNRKEITRVLKYYD